MRTNVLSKYPSSMCCRDSNPQPFEHESSTITTRPGPFNACVCHGRLYFKKCIIVSFSTPQPSNSSHMCHTQLIFIPFSATGSIRTQTGRTATRYIRVTAIASPSSRSTSCGFRRPATTSDSSFVNEVIDILFFKEVAVGQSNQWPILKTLYNCKLQL